MSMSLIPQLMNNIFAFFLSFLKNIRKYLLTEAKEKNHPEFLQGWQTAVTKVNGSIQSLESDFP